MTVWNFIFSNEYFFACCKFRPKIIYTDYLLIINLFYFIKNGDNDLLTIKF